MYSFASSTLALALVSVGVLDQSEMWAYPLARDIKIPQVLDDEMEMVLSFSLSSARV